MKPNIGTIDRGIRAIAGIAGIALIASFPLGLLSGISGVVALVVGAVLLLTAAVRWCPPYALLGINTGAAKD